MGIGKRINTTQKFENYKVHIFWEGHKILRNLHLTFDCMYCSQKLGEDFAKVCGLLRIYELYWAVQLMMKIAICSLTS